MCNFSKVCQPNVYKKRKVESMIQPRLPNSITDSYGQQHANYRSWIDPHWWATTCASWRIILQRDLGSIYRLCVCFPILDPAHMIHCGGFYNKDIEVNSQGNLPTVHVSPASGGVMDSLSSLPYRQSPASIRSMSRAPSPASRTSLLPVRACHTLPGVTCGKCDCQSIQHNTGWDMWQMWLSDHATHQG